jgi:hypothetical protein
VGEPGVAATPIPRGPSLLAVPKEHGAAAPRRLAPVCWLC